MKKVYIAGALSGLSEGRRVVLRKFYEDLGAVCRSTGYEPYVPHVLGDPTFFPKFTPVEIDRMDRKEVESSVLVVAYIGEPSTGAGIEIEMAYGKKVPVVLLFEREKMENRLISRLARGNPTVEGEIAFENFEDALRKFETWLKEFKPKT